MVAAPCADKTKLFMRKDSELEGVTLLGCQGVAYPNILYSPGEDGGEQELETLPFQFPQSRRFS